MKILLINKFLYPKGGDAISTLSTDRLLRAKGHKVILWGMEHPQNPEYPYEKLFVSYIDFNRPMGIFRQIKASIDLLYSFEAKNKIEKLLKKEKPDIVHLNNFAHQISPSILDVFHKYKIPTVMTLRDYKLVCPSYTMLANGNPCEKCKNGKYYWCFLKKCTKNSYIKSFLNTIEMYLHHKILHIYNQIDLIIATSQFLREKHMEMGFRNKIVCLPNFVNTEDYLPGYQWEEKAIVYFGRLSSEKGLFTLLNAVKGLDIQLKMIGDGQIRQGLEQKVRSEGINNVVFMGYKAGGELKKEIKSSMVTVLPSEWYEAFGRTIIESYALGKPVIGSRIGGIPELVKDNETGLTFEPGNSEDLKNKIGYFLKNPNLVIKMGKNAKKFVEENFNPEKHYQELMKIYNTVLKRRKENE